MTQVINANVSIQIPEGFEIIETDELNHLKEQTIVGRAWTMKELRQFCANKSETWLRDNILENPHYSTDMGKMERDGFIIHKGRGSAWKFKASVLADWIDKHWEELPW